MPGHAPSPLLEFRTPAGDTVRAELLAVRCEASDSRIEIAPVGTDLATIVDQQFFGLTSETAPTPLEVAGPFSITLRPGPEIVAAGGMAADEDLTPASVAAWIGRNAARLRSDAWLATRFTISRGGAAATTRTAWDFLPGFGELSHADEADATVVVRAVAAFLADVHPDLPFDSGLTDRILALLGIDGAAPAAVGGGPLVALHRFLVSRGAEPEMFDDGAGLRVAIEGESETWPCIALAAAEGAVVIYGIFPDPVATGSLSDAYGVIGRWNSRRPLAALDLNPASGHLAVRLPVLLDSRHPSDHLWQYALDTLLNAIDDAAEVAAGLAGASSAVVPGA